MSLLTAVEQVGCLQDRPRVGRLSLWLKRIAIAVPVIALGGLVGVNVLLMVPVVKDSLNRAVSRVVGATTDVGRITWSPWAGVRARNVRIAALQEATAVVDVPFFESDTAWVKVSFLPLFKGVLNVTEVGIDSPRIACVRGSDGRFLLPFDRGRLRLPGGLPATDISEEEKGSPGEGGVIEGAGDEVTPAEAGAPKPESKKNRVAAPARAKRSLDVRLGDIVIREGHVALLGNTAGRGLGELRDFQMRLNVATGEAGSFQASGATILGQIEFSEISGSVRANSSSFEFRDMVAHWSGGKIVGAADLGLVSPGAPFAVSLETEGFKPSHFLKSTESTDDEVKSLLDSEITAKLTLQGYARAVNSVAGSLRFDGLKIPLGSVLRAPSLDSELLDFEIAKIEFQLGNGGLLLSDVTFNADRVVVRAAGRASMSGELNVAVRTYVPETAVSAIGAFMKGWPKTRLMHFTALEHTNYIYRDMLLQGTIGDPAIDAWNDGTFFTIPALIDEVRELREAGTPPELTVAPASTPTADDSTTRVPGVGALSPAMGTSSTDSNDR